MYHFGRLDHRHNFSVYFYSSYLAASAEASSGDDCSGTGGGGGGIVTWLPFIPQVLLLLALAYRLARRHLHLCLLLSTMTFVAFNKVVTAQYFTWYACLTPLILPHILATVDNSKKEEGKWRVWVAVLLAWSVTAALWLWRAFLLEMRGQNTFLSVHLASLLFHAAQVGSVAVLLLELG